MTLDNFADSVADQINRSVVAELERQEVYSDDLENEVKETYITNDFAW